MNSKEQENEVKKTYYELNKVKILEQRKLYYELNKDKILEYNKEYKEKNKDNINQQKEIYYEENKERLAVKQKEYNKEYVKHKRLTDPIFKLKMNIKTRIYNSIRLSGFKKSSRTEQILGCTHNDFKIYLESKFEPWMTWDNYGLYNGTENYGWDIDHIIPSSSGKNEFEILQLNHFSNLQPLCSYYNRVIKSDNLI